ncbi:MAG: CPBP family intramembrane metalloprotease [Chloroflexi bacterium]|nr:CPBP family intramembrane metalloprotease [Chloroflexota bacterium]
MKRPERQGPPHDDQMAWPLAQQPTDDAVEAEVVEEIAEAVKPSLPPRIPHATLRPADPEPLLQEIEAEVGDEEEGLDEVDDDQEETEEEEHPSLFINPFQREVDPVFAYMVIMALSVGLSPVDASIRYVVLWAALGGAGLITYILGTSQRLSDTSVENLRTGFLFGLAIGIPFIILFGSALQTVSDRMFNEHHVPANIMNTWVFMAVCFVMPAADSLFFRGAMQELRGPLVSGILATIWSIVLFFPHMELGNASGIAVVVAIVFTLLNFLYGYLRYRNGLAAAWICQIVSGLCLWFLPRLIF